MRPHVRRDTTNNASIQYLRRMHGSSPIVSGPHVLYIEYIVHMACQSIHRNGIVRLARHITHENLMTHYVFGYSRRRHKNTHAHTQTHRRTTEPEMRYAEKKIKIHFHFISFART